MLKKGGLFYFSVPIGEQRIEFNAHRVFSVNYLIELLNQNFIIEQFSYIDDKGDFHKDAKLKQETAKTNFGCHYGCGIFVLQKK